MSRTLRSILALPAYLSGVGILFWCFQFACLTGFIKWWRLGGPRSDVQGVLCFLKFAFGFRVVKLGEKALHPAKCVYLANHRGWSDFFVDMWIIGARALPLSRRAVGFAFPAFASSLVAIKSILLFNRAGIRDTEKFNAWLDEQLVEGPQASLLVYPEGTRSQKDASLPLKRGMLRYAFTRRLPVQAVVTAHKEEVLNERRRFMHFGRTLVTGFSDVVESSQFEDFEDFMAAVQALWDSEWERVHAAPRQGLPEHQASFPATTYPPTTLALQTAALSLWTAALAGVAYCSLRALAALAAVPPLGPTLLAGLGLYTAASLAAAAWLPPPAAKGARRSGEGARKQD